MRVLFIGCVRSSELFLNKLLQMKADIVGVVTTPDKPAGRGLKVQESAVKRYAASVGLPILQPEKLTNWRARHISNKKSPILFCAWDGRSFWMKRY